MRIALDARTIFAPQRRGIGKSLLRLYQTLPLVRPDWRILAYHRTPGGVGRDLLGEAVEPRFIEMPGDRFDAWQRFRLPMAARFDGVDALHSPANTCPGWTPAPTVVTIHDLIPIDLPGTVDPATARRFRRLVGAACRRAAAITCPSIYTCRRLLRDMGVDSERVHVIPWGADAPPTLDEEAVASLLTRYRVRRPFVLHFGAADARKNTRRVVEAWAMLNEKAKRTWQLLVVGLDAASQAELLTMSQKLGLAENIVLHGFAHEDDVPGLLTAADVLLYPSRSEGFGLPILEAFAARTAVLTSSVTSLPEIADDAAVLVDPEDSVSLSNGLSRLLRDGVLRRDLVTRGSVRLHQFTWKLCAERFARAIEAAAGQSAAARRAAA